MQKMKCNNCGRVEEMRNDSICMACWVEPFPVLSVAREDLLAYFPASEDKIALLTDKKMHFIAARLQQVLVESIKFIDDITLASERIIRETDERKHD